MLSEDVHREHPIRIGSSTAHADYALRVEGRTVALVEAKPLGAELDENYAQQILSYAAVLKVKWCVLTNGRVYRVFCASWGTEPDDALFSEFELNPEAPLPDGLMNLSRETIQSGAMDVEASEARLLRLAFRLLRDSFEELQEEVYSAARRLVYAEAKKEIPGISRGQMRQVLERVLKFELQPLDTVMAKGCTSPPIDIREPESEVEGSTESSHGRWSVDGRNWHLTRKFAPTIKEKLLQLDGMLLSGLKVSKSSWNQKYYVSYYVNNRIWLYIEPKTTALILTFAVKPMTFTSAGLARDIGVADYARAQTLSEKMSLPSSVEVYEEDETCQTVIVRIKKDYDVGSAAFLGFLKRAREAWRLEQ